MPDRSSVYRHQPEYPEFLICTGMPSLDGLTVELRVVNLDEPPSPSFVVSIDSIIWVNMPPLPAPEPLENAQRALIRETIRPLFENYGLALVPCRVEERHPGYWIVAMPAVTGQSRLSVKPENIARRHRPKPQASS